MAALGRGEERARWEMLVRGSRTGGTDGRKDHCQFLAGPSILNRVQSIRRKGDDNSLSPRSEDNCFVVARDYCYQVSRFIFVFYFVGIEFYRYFFLFFSRNYSSIIPLKQTRLNWLYLVLVERFLKTFFRETFKLCFKNILKQEFYMYFF